MNKNIGIIIACFVCLLQYGSTCSAGSDRATGRWRFIDITAGGRVALAHRLTGESGEWDRAVYVVDIVDFDGSVYSVIDTINTRSNVYAFCNDSVVILDVGPSENRSLVTHGIRMRDGETTLLEHDLRDTTTWWMEYMNSHHMAVRLGKDSLVAYGCIAGVCVRRVHADNKTVELGFASDCAWPSISLDGTEVYYVRTRSGLRNESQVSIVAFDVKGEYNRVVAEIEEQVLWAPRGLGRNSPIYFLAQSDDGVRNVWVCNRNGEYHQVSTEEYPQSVDYFWLTERGIVCWLGDRSEKGTGSQRLRLLPLID